MENLIIDSTKEPSSPSISLDAQSGVCSIIGESYMESADMYYTFVIEWVKEYISSGKDSIEFNFNLNYFNTNSSRCILDILLLLKEFEITGAMVIVNWHFKKFDKDMIEEVEDFILDTGLEINLIPQ